MVVRIALAVVTLWGVAYIASLTPHPSPLSSKDNPGSKVSTELE